jgi:hypothetical protein
MVPLVAGPCPEMSIVRVSDGGSLSCGRPGRRAEKGRLPPSPVERRWAYLIPSTLTAGSRGIPSGPPSANMPVGTTYYRPFELSGKAGGRF